MCNSYFFHRLYSLCKYHTILDANLLNFFLQDTQLQTSSRASSTEEVSETILEEEEHAEQAAEEEIKAATPEDNDKGDSDNSLPDSPVLEASTLPDKSPIFREVAVTGGE